MKNDFKLAALLLTAIPLLAASGKAADLAAPQAKVCGNIQEPTQSLG